MCKYIHRKLFGWWNGDSQRCGVLQFMDPYRVFVPAISHEKAGTEEVIPGTETAGGEVALWGWISPWLPALSMNGRELMTREQIPCTEQARSLLVEGGLGP